MSKIRCVDKFNKFDIVININDYINEKIINIFSEEYSDSLYFVKVNKMGVKYAYELEQSAYVIGAGFEKRIGYVYLDENLDIMDYSLPDDYEVVTNC